jgi:tetratricopeptide (TPR) repeat protein
LPIDREATLKKAEKLLRQGKLDGAIAEYVRLVEEQPKDWNLLNALGDLYARAGQIDNASAQFVGIADHLFSEGFLPKAAALYKKSLKIKPDDEHTMLKLAEIATKQGVFVDAKTYYRQLAERRRKKGDERGADEIVMRVAELDPADADSKVQAARTAQGHNDTRRACEFLIQAAEAYEKQKRTPEALGVLAEALELDPEDTPLRRRLLNGYIAEGRIADARQIARSSTDLLAVAEVLEGQGQKAEALDVLTQAAEADPDNKELRTRVMRELSASGDADRARQFLDAEAAGDDPELLMALARMELEAGRIDEGKAALSRLLSIAPDRRDELMLVGCDLADQGMAEAAFACVDLVADAALLQEDWGGAASALHEFVTRVPNQIPALMKLVEICVDGGLESTMYMAQSQLADAYLAAGLGSEARVIAEDLVAREPWVRANIERFRRALIMLGVEDPDGVIAERLSGDSPFLSTVELPNESGAAPSVEPRQEQVALEEPLLELPDLLPLDPLPSAASPTLAADEIELTLDAIEIDLSDALTGAEAPPEEAPPLEDVFDDLRAKASREAQLQEAQAQYAAAIDHANNGRLDEAVQGFEIAARVPMMRFQAGSRLGRLHVAHGELAKGVEWLERAAQAPAPSPEDGHAVMYELADTLEHLGEPARALAVLLELSADAGSYRDIDARIDRLSKVQSRS